MTLEAWLGLLTLSDYTSVIPSPYSLYPKERGGHG